MSVPQQALIAVHPSPPAPTMQAVMSVHVIPDTSTILRALAVKVSLAFSSHIYYIQHLTGKVVGKHRTSECLKLRYKHYHFI